MSHTTLSNSPAETPCGSKIQTKVSQCHLVSNANKAEDMCNYHNNEKLLFDKWYRSQLKPVKVNDKVQLKPVKVNDKVQQKQKDITNIISSFDPHPACSITKKKEAIHSLKNWPTTRLGQKLCQSPTGKAIPSGTLTVTMAKPKVPQIQGL